MSFENGPYLSIATFCENVIEDKSGVLSLIRLIDRIEITAHGEGAPEQMPPTNLANLSLALVFKSGMAKGSHELKIETEQPSGIKTSTPFHITLHLPGGNMGQNVVLKGFPLKVEMTGVYWICISIDNELYTKIPMEIIYSRIITPPPLK
jgi:hypothetical protein